MECFTAGIIPPCVTVLQDGVFQGSLDDNGPALWPPLPREVSRPHLRTVHQQSRRAVDPGRSYTQDQIPPTQVRPITYIKIHL